MATNPTRRKRPARKPKPAAKTTSKVGRNRADADEVQNRRDVVQERMIDGEESAATVAKDLGITAGKAAFIAMQLRVENGDVPKIVFKNDEQLISRTVAARDKADQYSSWGWLAARTGVGEATLKSKVENAGHSVSGTRIASIRKTNGNGNGSKSTKKAAPAKAKARTRTRRAQADPS
jgi:hypothetical protein